MRFRQVCGRPSLNLSSLAWLRNTSDNVQQMTTVRLAQYMLHVRLQLHAMHT